MISVILPTRGESSKLRFTFDSYLSQVNKNFELVLINHGEDDELKKIISEYKAKGLSIQTCQLKAENHIPCTALAYNVGAKMAKGEILVFTSPLTMFADTNIDRATCYLDYQPKAVIYGMVKESFEKPDSFSHNSMFHMDGNLLCGHKKYPDEDPSRIHIIYMPKDLFVDIGGFEESFMQGYGYDDKEFGDRIKANNLEIIADWSIVGIKQIFSYPEEQELIKINKNIYEHLDHSRVKANVDEPWGAIQLPKDEQLASPLMEFPKMFYRYLPNGARVAMDLDDMFHDESCFIVGGGKDSAKFGEFMRGIKSVHIIAINNAATIVKPTIWVGADKVACYSDSMLVDPTTMKFSLVKRKDLGVQGKPLYWWPNTYFINVTGKFDERNFFSGNKDFVWWRNTFFIAIQLAYRLGFKTIYFVGCGFNASEKYAWDSSLTDEEIAKNQKLYNNSIAQLKEIMKYMKDIQMFSCTPGSPLNEFMHFRDYKEVIKSILDKIPCHHTANLPHSSKT